MFYTEHKRVKLLAAVNELLEHHRKEREEKNSSLYGFSRFAHTLLHSRIPQCADPSLNVLVIGETGTGKELVVNEIKRLLKIPDDNFLAVNCAQFSKELLASELFGHKKGAFTGAIVDKPAIFADLDGGALFLDELGAMPQELQAQILRVMEEKAYRAVGSAQVTKLQKGVRFFAATSKADDIRQDLRWRFQEQIFIAPLRERLSDVFAILQGLLDNAKEKDKAIRPEVEWAIRPDTFVRIVYSFWPGNVRELRNAVDRSIARWKPYACGSDRIDFQYITSNDDAAVLQDVQYIELLWKDLVKAITALRDRKRPKSLPKDPFGSDRMEHMTDSLTIPQIHMGVGWAAFKAWATVAAAPHESEESPKYIYLK